MIGPSSHISKFLLSLFFLLLVFFVFMDVNMILRIQNYPLSRDKHTAPTSSELTGNWTVYSNGTKKDELAELYKIPAESVSHLTVYSSTQQNLKKGFEQREYEQDTWVTCDINPLCYPTVKALMLDHTNHYIFAPVVSILDDLIGVSERMPYITPNLISYSHVGVAMIAGKLISIDSLAYRRLGVVLFQIRTLMDDLDGHVARARKHILGERSEVGTAGFYIDGFCDLLGCICLVIGIFCFLKNNPPRRGYVKVHTVLPHYNESITTKEATDSNGEVGFVYKPKVSMERMLRKIFLFSGQLLVSSMAWNRYIDIYQQTLEREESEISEAQLQRQTIAFRSGLFFAISWLWKIVNVHSLLHCILFAIFCDKLWEFLRFMQFVGYGLLVVSIGLTEMHVMKVQSYVFKLVNSQAPS